MIVASYVAALRQETVAKLQQLAIFKRVFDSRQAQISRPMLPALRVYASQTSEGRSINIPDFLTTTNLVVQVVADDITDAKSAFLVDELMDIVKDHLMGDPEWLQGYEQISSVETEIERNIEGETRTTVATITFALTVSEYYEPRIPDTLEVMHVNVRPIVPAGADAEFRVTAPPRPVPQEKADGC